MFDSDTPGPLKGLAWAYPLAVEEAGIGAGPEGLEISTGIYSELFIKTLDSFQKNGGGSGCGLVPGVHGLHIPLFQRWICSAVHSVPVSIHNGVFGWAFRSMKP